MVIYSINSFTELYIIDPILFKNKIFRSNDKSYSRDNIVKNQKSSYLLVKLLTRCRFNLS